ncbi:MAG: penicillin-binding protein, family, partial [Deltaproteobacteria bacterium]|nr:penicillin-binding protein, family [Deltaproteobacteria bacterium]
MYLAIEAGGSTPQLVFRHATAFSMVVSGAIVAWTGLPRWARGLSIVFFRLMFLLMIYGASLGASIIYFAVSTLNEELPKDLSQLLDYQPNRKSVVLSSDGEEVGTFSIENRRIVALDRMPAHLPAAFLSAEDRRFYSHKGFDLIGITRAAWTNLRSDGNIKQGGSTITQQIIKQTLLVSEESVGALGLTSAQYEKVRKAQKY